MRAYFVLIGSVAALKLLVTLGLLVDVLWRVPANFPAELSCLVTFALLIGSMVHYARRGTVVPPRPLVSITGAVLLAPLLALALAGPYLRAAWSPSELVFEASFVLFQMVGFWIVGGVLFGGPFAAPASHADVEPGRRSHGPHCSTAQPP